MFNIFKTCSDIGIQYLLRGNLIVTIELDMSPHAVVLLLKKKSILEFVLATTLIRVIKHRNLLAFNVQRYF